MVDQKNRVLETISCPERVLEGDFGALQAVRLYTGTPLTTKFLIAIYKEISKDDGFVLTAFFATEPLERRKLLWKR